MESLTCSSSETIQRSFSQTFANVPSLPQGAGYGVVIGIGLFFSVFMLGLTTIQSRYTGFSHRSAVEFNSASRSVKPGLIASGIVSAWTMAATLLQSSAVAYKFGISGPWWYGAGATVQVLLFAQLAAKLKLNAPYAYTWLEIISARWGKVAHLVFMYFGLATNTISSSMLILGGSATVTDLTGMNTLAACFLIPIGVAIYVVVGGMRATLLCDYTHTTVLFVVMFVFVFSVYFSNQKIGSFSKMHELLTQAAVEAPLPGNAHGSYLTMRSKSGLIFGVINVIGNFSTVFQDQVYWQRAIASRPATSVRAFILGGLAWFSIPFMFSTTLGLAAVALRHDPAMKVLTSADVAAGLPAPSAAVALFGQAGAAVLLVVLFLAVTSATSAELIAVSSILTYDIYKRYINPHATDSQILSVSHAMVALFAFAMGLLGLIFYYIGISLGWLYLFMGVILGGGVFPIVLAVTSRKANKWGCVGGAIAGFCSGVIAWMAATAILNGGIINMTTTGGDYEMLAGNLASISVGGIISCVTTYLWPEEFDFDVTRAVNAPVLSSRGNESSDAGSQGETKTENVFNDVDAEAVQANGQSDKELDPVALNKAFRIAAWSSVALTLILIILVPLPLFFAQTIFGVGGLKAWVGIGLAWAFTSAILVILWPLWESRVALSAIIKGIIKDVSSHRSGKYVQK